MVGTTMYNILYEKSIPWELPLKFQEYINYSYCSTQNGKKKGKVFLFYKSLIFNKK